MELAKRFEPEKAEKEIYQLWESSGFFNPDNLPRAKPSTPTPKPFTIIMPPPNANGPLHIGHALFVALEDAMIRYKRMRGFRALWLPGADHAGFETQVVFDKKLEKEGRNRFAMPREELYREIHEFTQKNKAVMENQLRSLGASCDWSREVFTLDQKIIDIVYDTFIKLYRDGLAYRDLRVINWCPKHQTALSDLEVKYVERIDPLYYIKYGPLTLATVRPETKFGDTALAVNPKDSRYKKYIGKTIEAQGLLGPLTFKVIADKAVDPAFGTGVVKVTPAHDAADFEIWQRHKEEIPGPFDYAQGKSKIIIDERGRLTGESGPYKGMKVAEARAKVAEDMEKAGILEKVDPNYQHQVATCYKCGSVLEPLPKLQWFIRMTTIPRPREMRNEKLEMRKSLRDLAVEAVKTGKIKFVTKKFEKIFFHWMRNLRDWNISRQIVWGIRIPAWYRGEEVYVGEEPPRGDGWMRDTDVFDTWFSSGQWPFAALRATSKKRHGKSDFESFYPTDVMETGYDILFFWVARMIMLGLYATGKVPFKTVYLHGLVRDKDRQKMSKSKGNVSDPLGMVDRYGADAVRMALIAGTAPGNDPIITEEKIRGYRNFATKLWNMFIFVLKKHKARTDADLTRTNAEKDKKILAELKKVKKEITDYFETHQLHLAAEKLYAYVWHTVADKIIEETKAGKVSAKTLARVFFECLVMLHPLMPFVTEAIYQRLPASVKKTPLLMVHPWQ